MHRASFLLQLFLSLLSARGLHADAPDAWRGWVTFKQYARIAHQVPDPGVSVQISTVRTGLMTRRPSSTAVYWLDV